jgi:hypothetical protein
MMDCKGHPERSTHSVQVRARQGPERSAYGGVHSVKVRTSAPEWSTYVV